MSGNDRSMALPLSVIVVNACANQNTQAVSLCEQLGIGFPATANNIGEGIALIEKDPAIPKIVIIDLSTMSVECLEFIQRLSHWRASVSLMLCWEKDTSLVCAVETLARSFGIRVLGALKKPITLDKFQANLDHLKSGLAQQTQATAESIVNSHSLRDALARKEFYLDYQPKIELASGLIKGVEALVRWRHPQNGLIMPAQFIPVAENIGIINELTIEIVRMALDDHASWKKQGLKLSIAINLSARSLLDTRLGDEIIGLVEKSQVAPQDIILEITESSAIEDLATALGVLLKLRIKGFGLSLDDYGTGFSSMQQLSRIPFTELKIDRSLVDGASRKAHLQVILESAVSLARKLDILSTAEGVENEDDFKLLKALGCDFVQGYFIARPMPAADFPGWVHARSAAQDISTM